LRDDEVIESLSQPDVLANTKTAQMRSSGFLRCLAAVE